MLIIDLHQENCACGVCTRRGTHLDLTRYFYLSILSTTCLVRYAVRLFYSGIVILWFFKHQTRSDISDLMLLILATLLLAVGLAIDLVLLQIFSTIFLVIPWKVKKLFGPFANSSSVNITFLLIAYMYNC